ncbi:hypothetical protein TruAng_000958 [Truncatella angustata]|nr:hypothetical protein TruAng_000958 [Truncatella angustata]
MSITVSLNECRCSGLALTYEREPSFCTLPRELRNEIYTLAVVKYDDQLDDAVEPGIITLKGSHGYHFTRDVGVDRQIRAKASPIFYGQINFVLEVPGRCLEFAEWAALRRICAAVGAHLKHLRRLEIMFAYPAHTGQDDDLAVSDNYIFDPTSVTCVKIDELDMLKQRARIEFAIDRDFMGQTADRLRQAERGMALAILQLRAEHRWLDSVFPTSGMMFAVFEILYKAGLPRGEQIIVLHSALRQGVRFRPRHRNQNNPLSYRSEQIHHRRMVGGRHRDTVFPASVDQLFRLWRESNA